MREIKFRCWNIAAKAMYPLEHFALTMEGRELQLMPKCEHYDKPYILNEGHLIYMQYTGLKDKNGREIYEGDIAEFSVKNEFGSWEDRRAEMKFINGCFKFEFDSDRDVEGIDNLRGVIVIGNIYENPNLIKHENSNG